MTLLALRVKEEILGFGKCCGNLIRTINMAQASIEHMGHALNIGFLKLFDCHDPSEPSRANSLGVAETSRRSFYLHILFDIILNV